MNHIKVNQITKIDELRNELDIQYSQSKILKWIVLSGINYQIVPASLRNFFGKIFHKKNASPARDFPIDKKVETLRGKLFEGEEVKFWPKKFAVCFTHDVDTKYGFEEGIDSLREIEIKHGIKSTWNIIPKANDYEIDVEKLKRLDGEGNEIGVHGLHHDGKFAFIDSDKRKSRIRKGKEVLENLGFRVTGFRAPWLHRTRDLIYFLEKYNYLWDSSFPDTDPSTIGYEGTGCSTVFPFYPLIKEDNGYRYSNVLELPITIPQDWTLIHSLGYSDKEILELWKIKVDYIENIGGLALFLIHPDKYDFGDPDRSWVYEEIIKYVAKKNPFRGTCREITQYLDNKKVVI